MGAPFPISMPGTADLARALHARKALEQALHHGTALLAALGLPRLVDPGFVPVDRETAGAALADAMALLDAIDAPEEDLEPEGELLEAVGDDELDLGWAANVSQVALGPNTGDGDLTAPERFGRDFVRCGPDDAEDGHDAEGLNDEGGDEAEEIGIHPGLVRGRPLTRAERAAVRGLARQAMAMREAAHV